MALSAEILAALEGRHRRWLLVLDLVVRWVSSAADRAHDFVLLHYYATREDQERQLADHGFEVLECLDLEGRSLPAGESAPHCSELHYVSRRSPD